MTCLNRLLAPVLLLAVVSGVGAQQPPPAQNPPPVVPLPAPAAPNANAVAATVNGQQIHEISIDRALRNFPADKRHTERANVLDLFIENAMVDQYLVALKVEVTPGEVEQKIQEFREELKKHKEDYATVLGKMGVTDAEFRQECHNQLRWDKFVAQQASDAKLEAFFNQTPEGFDGTMIRARHILITSGADVKSRQEAAAKLLEIKKQIQKTVADGMAKLPADADNLTREKRRVELTEETFIQAARGNSACPSKEEGGDLRWFPRFGPMIEPFAKAAFALKPNELSDIVNTPFGCHLILVVGRKPGTPVKYADPNVKEMVRSVYESKLKDAVVEQMKPRVKVEIFNK